MKVPGGSEGYFPSFWEGLSLRLVVSTSSVTSEYISLPFGRDFREPKRGELPAPDFVNFPSFWEGLSLRRGNVAQTCPSGEAFPFLFGGGFH